TGTPSPRTSRQRSAISMSRRADGNGSQTFTATSSVLNAIWPYRDLSGDRTEKRRLITAICLMRKRAYSGFGLHSTPLKQRVIIMGVLLWVLLIGFIAGVIARLIMPGPNTPKGFVVTTILGVAGAFLASFVGEAIGWYRPGQGAGLIGATVGAIVILFVWHRLVASKVIPGHGL